MTRTPLRRAVALAAGPLAAALVLSGCSLKTEQAQQTAAASDAAPAAATAAADVPSLAGKRVGIAAKDVVHDISRVFYDSVQARVEELGGEVIATQAEADDEKHITDVENLIAQKPDAIVIILGDATTLSATLDQVKAAGIPLFTIDFQTPAAINQVQSDNWQIGSTLARNLAEEIGGRGNVLVFNGFPGVAPCRIRYNELKLVLEDYPDIQIVQPELIEPYEGTVEFARSATNDILQRYPEGQLSAVWACWDIPEIGAAQAIDAAGRTDVKVFGVDADPGALELISDPDSSYTATVAQQGEAIGTASIDNVARYLGGQQADVPKTTYLEPRYIDKDNVDEVVSELGLTVGS